MPSRDRLDDIANGYQASQILLTANRLGLFGAIGDGDMSADELASNLDASPRGVRILCDALAGIGLLEKTPEGYRAGDEIRRHLLPSSPEPRSALLRHGAKLYERWGHLFDSVKTGRPVSDALLDPRLVGGERNFARAMADVGRRSAAVTCDQLDLSGVKTLLDIGGGPGIYAVEFAQRWPALEVTILDRQETLEIALKNAEKASLTDRIHLRPGDALEDDLGGPYDAIFISNLIHIYSATENRQLIRRCADSLNPGGHLVLKDFFLDEDRTNPPGGAVFAVNMLISTEGGDCYAISDVRSWVTGPGLEYRGTKDVGAKSRLLFALKM